MYTPHAKRSYHPLLVVLFHLQILDESVLKRIPYLTRSHWRNINQQDQFGYEAVRDYLEAQMDIRSVYTSKLLFRFTRFTCRMYDGFRTVIGEMTRITQMSNETANEIVRTIEYLSEYVNVRVASKVMNTTYQSYYRLRNKITCGKSKRGKCFRLLPQQLSLRELQVINNTISDPENFHIPKSTLYYRLLNTGKLFCSLSTFYAYSVIEGRIIRKPAPVRETLRAARVFQYLHVDITEMANSSGIYYLAFVKDNFSKAILGWKLFCKRSSSHIRNLFTEVFERHNLKDHPAYPFGERISIVSDGGSENKGEFLIWIAQQVVPEVKKLTAGIDVKSNSMSESVHHILKNEYLRGKIPEDIPSAIERFVDYHNNQRYPVEHFGFTCNEVLHGAKPDSKRFSEKIKGAKLIRLEENRKFSCIKNIGCKS